MILRSIIYVGILIFFLWDYRKDKKSFKKYIFPIIAITYFGGSDYFINSDDRIRLTVMIIALLLVIRYLFDYYNDYKIEKFREKKRKRKNRERQRLEKADELLEKILEAKNFDLKNKSKSYEIIVEMSSKVSEVVDQISFFNEESGEEVYRYDDYDEIEDESISVLENKLEMFQTEHKKNK